MKRRSLIFTFVLLLSSLIVYRIAYAYGLPQPPSVIINIIVYVTEGNTDFHRSGCGLLYGKQITGIPLGEAYKEGYTPYGHCKPPQINGMLSDKPTGSILPAGINIL